jgi:hypothetical protein
MVLGSGIRKNPGSRIQGSKRHRIPDPQHWLIVADPDSHPDLTFDREIFIIFPTVLFFKMFQFVFNNGNLNNSVENF